MGEAGLPSPAFPPSLNISFSPKFYAKVYFSDYDGLLGYVLDEDTQEGGREMSWPDLVTFYHFLLHKNTWGTLSDGIISN